MNKILGIFVVPGSQNAKEELNTNCKGIEHRSYWIFTHRKGVGQDEQNPWDICGSWVAECEGGIEHELQRN